MACSCCACGNIADRHFNAEKVAKELRHYRRKGPGPTTRGLRDGFVSIGYQQGTVLDIGGGLASSVWSCSTPDSVGPVVVKASSAYLCSCFRRGCSSWTVGVNRVGPW